MGFIFNNQRLPLVENGKEQLFEGMRMVGQPCLQVYVWPSVSNVAVMLNKLSCTAALYFLCAIHKLSQKNYIRRSIKI